MSASFTPPSDPLHEPNFGSLQNLRAVVTGASSGIGREIALEFARAGANVLVHCSRSIEAAEKTAQQIRDYGRESSVLSADFSDSQQLDSFVETAWAQFGPIDIWVNNAGADLLTGTASQWNFSQKLQRLFDVDIRSTLQLSRDAGQRMFERKQKNCTLLNIGWDQADRGMEGTSGELFSASKNAIMGFSRSLAVSLAPNVRVNCIAPGWIRTQWGETASDAWQQRVLRETPLNRWGTPADIAKVARFLASDDAAYLTGQVINVNGGAIR